MQTGGDSLQPTRRGADTPSQQTPKGGTFQGALAHELFRRKQFCPRVGGVQLHLLVQIAPEGPNRTSPRLRTCAALSKQTWGTAGSLWTPFEVTWTRDEGPALWRQGQGGQSIYGPRDTRDCGDTGIGERQEGALGGSWAWAHPGHDLGLQYSLRVNSCCSGPPRWWYCAVTGNTLNQDLS